MLRPDQPIPAKNESVLDHIFQLTNISGPIIRHEDIKCLMAQAGYGFFPNAVEVFYPSWSVEDELNELKGYASGLEEELNNIRTQIAELEKEQAASDESQ